MMLLSDNAAISCKTQKDQKKALVRSVLPVHSDGQSGALPIPRATREIQASLVLNFLHVVE